MFPVVVVVVLFFLLLLFFVSYSVYVLTVIVKSSRVDGVSVSMLFLW